MKFIYNLGLLYSVEIYILNIDYSKLAKTVSFLIMIKKHLALFQIA